VIPGNRLQSAFLSRPRPYISGTCQARKKKRQQGHRIRYALSQPSSTFETYVWSGGTGLETAVNKQDRTPRRPAPMYPTVRAGKTVAESLMFGGVSSMNIRRCPVAPILSISRSGRAMSGQLDGGSSHCVIFVLWGRSDGGQRPAPGPYPTVPSLSDDEVVVSGLATQPDPLPLKSSRRSTRRGRASISAAARMLAIMGERPWSRRLQRGLRASSRCWCRAERGGGRSTGDRGSGRLSDGDQPEAVAIAPQEVRNVCPAGPRSLHRMGLRLSFRESAPPVKAGGLSRVFIALG